MLQSPLETNKEILGYQLKERIGSGGFGEVWSAEAPGGLMKAVKIVFGYHDGKRAQAELKALDRVKQLRHPFLLSLERIEVFEGQLVVVSELADCSLADQFNKNLAAGKDGIDREDILRYMRCSAEALDYLSDSHGLQHLDIKPENLLVIGEHVKVADFGLIKDLHKVSQSLMSGMTPAYAAPELFDGRPGKYSDQYSLAIVYQEMLTGCRPFSGSTPAQLAAQHMNGKPDLLSLPASDQIIIAKALSKDPSCRFQSCCELVEQLTNRRRSAKKSSPRRTKTHINDDSNTLNLNSSNTHDVTALISGSSLPFQASEVKVLDAPDCSETDTKVRPTIYIGIGSTGNKIIQKIKTQLTARYGSMENLPSLKLHAIDSDRGAIDEIIRSSTCPLAGKEVIETPLKKPECYRAQKKSHLGWLSRRWIYNIPRTLQTEGLRPLGRLAYADNFDHIYNTLEESIREITKAENLATTADALDIDPGSLTPRVFIVTSISGGLGGGMTLDLAYSLRLLIHEAGHEPDSVVGMMLHSTYQRLRDPGLSSANAFAFLSELRHFCEIGFPGDSENGVPEFEDSPFDFTYFEDLGQNLCQSDFDKKLEGVAEYMMLASASKCSSFFDKCRDFENEEEHFGLRTFGISVTGPGKFDAGLKAAQLVGNQLMRHWIGGDHQTDEQVESLSAELTTENQLEIEDVSQRIQFNIETNTKEQLPSLLSQIKDTIQADDKTNPLTIAKILDEIYLVPPERQSDNTEASEVHLELEKEIENWAPEIGEQIVSAIQNQMSGKSMNLALSLKTSKQLTEQFQSNIKQLESLGSELSATEIQLLNKLTALNSSRTKQKPDWTDEVNETVNQYVLSRKQLTIYRHTRSFYRIVSRSVDSLNGLLQRYRRQLESVASNLKTDGIVDTCETDAEFCMETLLSDAIKQQTQKHVLETEALVYDGLISDYGGYASALESASLWQNKLQTEISKQAQRVLADAYKKLSLDQVLAEHSVPPELLAQWVNDQMRQASPKVNDCGGGTRLMIGMPSLSEDNSLETILAKQFELKASTIRGTDGSFAFCFEGEGVGLANVAFRLLQERPDALELVKRIQTRSDIQWKTLDDLL